MSTPNFTITRVMNMLDLPLMVQSDEMLYKYVMEEFPTEDTPTEDYYWEVHIGFDCLMDDIDSKFDELKNKLYTLKVEIIDGYYTGIQFVIDTNDMESNYIDISAYDWDEWELSTYFNADTIEEAKENLANEVKAINEFLEEMKSYGFRPLNCDGVFSNGEAIYSWAD